MRDKRPLISASEVGDYVFCARAWRLRAEGNELDDESRAMLDAGTEYHHAHGGQVRRARRLRTASIALAVLSLLLALLLILRLVLR